MSETYTEQQNTKHQKRISGWAWIAIGNTIVLLAMTCIIVHVLFRGNSNNIPITQNASDSPTTDSSNNSNIEYSLEHLLEAIKVLENYQNYGAPCGFSDEWVYPEVWDFLNKSQMQWVNDLKCSECCCSIAEAKEHLGQFLAPDMCEDFSNNNYVEYRGFLYVALGGLDYSEYRAESTESQVTRISYNQIYVIMEKFDSMGEFLGDTRIDFEYQNGRYKIVQVTDLDSD